MKIQISFDLTDLDKALSIATKVAPYADSLEIGSILIYKYGLHAIEQFRKEFPDKVLLADAKIVDNGKNAVTILAEAGTNWVTVMAGTRKNIIHSVSTTAHDLGKQVMLDLLDSCSLGQSALEAKSMGVDALLLHRPHDEEDALKFMDTWDMVKGNSSLPIYVSGKITADNIDKMRLLKPDGIVISKAITEAENPEDEAKKFKQALS
ncbi:MAG: orotidine 5'-phosphate decarboxylase / HUMPS family protein [Candidatus Babeliales bacterium]